MQVENINGTLYGFGGAVPYGQHTPRASSVTDRYQNDNINSQTTVFSFEYRYSDSLNVNFRVYVMDQKYKWNYFEKKLYHFRAFHSTIGLDQTVFIIGGLEKFKKDYSILKNI